MKKYFLLLLLILSTPLFAQIKPIVSSTKTFHILEGTIDNKYPITMRLIIDKNPPKADGKYYYDGIGYSSYFGEIVYGQYYYNNIKTPIYFGEGVWRKQNKLILEEFTSQYSRENSTGEFTGTLNTKMIFKGTWSNGKKSFDFEVEPNKKSEVQEIEIKEYTFTDTIDSDNFYFSAKIPQIANSKKLSSIKKINKELNDLGSFDIYSEWKREIKDDPSSWILNSYYDFIFIDDNILSLLYTELIQRGGPYPNTESLPLVYSLNSGEILKVADLVYSVEDKKLIALMQQKIREHMRQKSGGEDAHKSDEEISQSFYDFNSIRLGNYTIEPSEITFIYSQGELAAHVYGRIEISFTYDELKPFIKKDSEINYLFE